MALGKEHNPNLGFYANVHEKKILDNFSQINTDSEANSSEEKSPHLSGVTTEEPTSPIVHNSSNQGARQNNIQSEIFNILTDLHSQLQEGDDNLLKGVQKFICTYKRLQSGHAPTASIASALHHFGRNYGKLMQ